MTDRNEAMRLADRISPETDWYEFDQVTWCNEAAALLRQLSAERDQLRAEVERLRADAERLDWLLWRIPNAIRHCVGELAYTSDGDKFRAAIDHARTTHKETE